MLECNKFAIQEHKKILSSVQSYDIRNGETGVVKFKFYARRAEFIACLDATTLGAVLQRARTLLSNEES